MMKLLEKVERLVIYFLLTALMLTVLVTAVELVLLFLSDMRGDSFMLLSQGEILEVFGFFLMVLLGLELLGTIKAYLDDHHVHVEVVLLVAMIAVGRKIIILDYTKVDASHFWGMSALVISLAAGYYLLKKTLREEAEAKARDRES